MSEVWSQYPNGNSVVTHALTVTAGISLLAVIITLVGIAVTGFRTHHQFARSQVGAYFLSLVLSDLLQAAGSLMNAKWVVIHGVSMGNFCTTQAALKQTGNVGTALWSLVIAAHTFSLLFLRRRIRNIVFYCILVGVWLFIGFVIMMGPIILENDSQGPFWGISGYWCWITDSYHIEQFTDEYLFMFLTAGVSTLLYGLIFFRLRGNLYGSGWNLRFCRVKEPWRRDDDDDSQMSAVGKQMLWYPVAYTILIVPIASCRWSVIFGHKVPYRATMTADAIFMLSGFVNAILYSTTRKIVSISMLLPFRRFMRIVSRREHQARQQTHASLDEIQFSLPVDNRGVLKFVSGSIPLGDPKDPLDMWQSRRGCEFPEYFRTQLDNTDKSQTPWLIKSDSMSGHSDTEEIADVYVTPNGILPLCRSGSPQTMQPPEKPRCQSVHEDIPQADPDIEACHIRPHRDSVSTSTTGGTPTVHHKRFSGWSLPSIQRACKDDEGSVFTDMESMRFATPSPERIARKPSSQSRSNADLPSSSRPKSSP